MANLRSNKRFTNSTRNVTENDKLVRARAEQLRDAANAEQLAQGKTQTHSTSDFLAQAQAEFNAQNGSN